MLDLLTVYKSHYTVLGELDLDEYGNLERKDNVIVANEELATENTHILDISSILKEFFTSNSL